MGKKVKPSNLLKFKCYFCKRHIFKQVLLPFEKFSTLLLEFEFDSPHKDPNQVFTWNSAVVFLIHLFDGVCLFACQSERVFLAPLVAPLSEFNKLNLKFPMKNKKATWQWNHSWRVCMSHFPVCETEQHFYLYFSIGGALEKHAGCNWNQRWFQCLSYAWLSVWLNSFYL